MNVGQSFNSQFNWSYRFYRKFEAPCWQPISLTGCFSAVWLIIASAILNNKISRHWNTQRSNPIHPLASPRCYIHLRWRLLNTLRHKTCLEVNLCFSPTASSAIASPGFASLFPKKHWDHQGADVQCQCNGWPKCRPLPPSYMARKVFGNFGEVDNFQFHWVQ